MKILVIDVGGTHIKVSATSHKTEMKIPSGTDMTAGKMVSSVKKIITGWKYEAITIGYPGPVVHGHIISEPYNLGRGWVGYNFKKAFHCKVKIINDAAMQAVGSQQMAGPTLMDSLANVTSRA
jgi:predicted NBD/HSP70 family sugar kinase